MSLSWFARSYTKLQALYMAGPGSIKTVGTYNIFAISDALPSIGQFLKQPNLNHWDKINYPSLCNALDIDALLSPPIASDENNTKYINTLRFPETEYCQSCGHMQYFKEKTHAGKNKYMRSQLGKCENKDYEGHAKMFNTIQFEKIWVCKAGHLDTYSPFCTTEGCPGILKKKGLLGVSDRVNVYCGICEITLELKDSKKDCSGRMPNAPTGVEGFSSVGCPETMVIRDIRDSLVWQPRILTALYLPQTLAVSSFVLDEIRNTMGERSWVDASEFEQISQVKVRLTNLGIEIPISEDIKIAINELSKDLSSSDIRVDEFKVISDLINRDANFSTFVGGKATTLNSAYTPIKCYSSIKRLRMITYLDKVRRLDGEYSRNIIWGYQPHDTKNGRTLPAFESYGEGVVFWVDIDWYNSQGIKKDISLHTLSHAVLKAISVTAGISISALRERVYIGTPENPLPGFIIYLSSGDQVGTIGGLSNITDDGKELENVLTKAMRDTEWCRLDPFCRDDKNSACYHCVYLPETCCDYIDADGGSNSANTFLDRSTLSKFWL